ncbi:MAG: hypothetical protein HWE11_13825 [Gammaproteobacteria bacterium]|nr:hypothetical protein [Gammaproteobacteria bacterium]
MKYRVILGCLILTLSAGKATADKRLSEALNLLQVQAAAKAIEQRCPGQLKLTLPTIDEDFFLSITGLTLTEFGAAPYGDGTKVADTYLNTLDYYIFPEDKCSDINWSLTRETLQVDFESYYGYLKRLKPLKLEEIFISRKRANLDVTAQLKKIFAKSITVSVVRVYMTEELKELGQLKPGMDSRFSVIVENIEGWKEQPKKYVGFNTSASVDYANGHKWVMFLFERNKVGFYMPLVELGAYQSTLGPLEWRNP